MSVRTIPALSAYLDATDMGDEYTVQDYEDSHGTFSGSYDECWDYIVAAGAGTYTMTNTRIGTQSIIVR